MKDNDVKIVNDDSVTDIVKVIETHRENAYRKINEELVTMYYEIVKYLSEKVAFEIMKHTLTVKIPYNKLAMDLDKASNDTQNDTQKSIEERIIEIMKDNPTVTRDELANIIGKSKATITRAIKSSNKIKYIGPSKGGHWEIK